PPLPTRLFCRAVLGKRSFAHVSDRRRTARYDSQRPARYVALGRVVGMVQLQAEVRAEGGAVAGGRERTAPKPDRSEWLAVVVGCVVALEVGWVAGLAAILYWAFA